MTEVTALGMAGLFSAFLAGVGLGAIFFGGLWLTVRRTLSSSTLGVVLMAGFMLRVSIVLAGFYAISLGGWQRMIPSLLGFLMARLLITRWVRTVHVDSLLIATPGPDAP